METLQIDCKTLLRHLMGYTKTNPANSKEFIKVPPSIKAEELSPSQKKAIVIYLLNTEKYHNYEIGDIIGYSSQYISTIKKEFEEGLIYLVDEVQVRKMASRHIKRAETAYKELNKQGKWKDSWEVMRGLIQDLQSLGFINKEPEKFEDVTYEKLADRWEALIGFKYGKVDPEVERKLTANANNN